MLIIYIFRQGKYIYSGDTLGGISLFLLFFRRNCVNEIMEKEMISIDDMIYEVRGVQVMLDSELAPTK